MDSLWNSEMKEYVLNDPLESLFNGQDFCADFNMFDTDYRGPYIPTVKECPPVLGATYNSEPMNLDLILERLEDREESIGIEKENMLSLSPIGLDCVFKKKLEHMSQNDVSEIFDKFAPGTIQKSDKTTSEASTITNNVKILQLPKFNTVPATTKASVQVPLAPEERRANFSEHSIRPGLLSRLSK